MYAAEGAGTTQLKTEIETDSQSNCASASSCACARAGREAPELMTSLEDYATTR